LTQIYLALDPFLQLHELDMQVEEFTLIHLARHGSASPHRLSLFLGPGIRGF
jgi:hypothetical protein